MIEQVQELVRRYAGRGLLLDTNLMLLLCMGDFDPKQIPRFKRTAQYQSDDYATLSALIRPFESRLMTSPNILTEVNGLANQLDEGSKSGFFQRFSRRITLLHEEHQPSVDVAGMVDFPKYGLTDLGIYLSARGRYLVLTDDFKLFGFLRKQGVDALNFNHVRPLG